MSRTYLSLAAAMFLVAVIGVRVATRPNQQGVIVPRLSESVQLMKGDVTSSTLALSAQTGSHGDPYHIPVVQPVILDTDLSGHVFLADTTIREFDADGHPVETCGSTAKRFKSIADVSASADHVWVADLLGHAMHQCNRITGKWTRVATTFEPYRLQPGTDTHQLIAMAIGEPKLFRRVTTDGTVLDSFGDLLQNQKEASLALDGFIARTAAGMAFVGKSLGVVASFSVEGTLLWARTSITDPPIPLVRDLSGKRMLERSSLPTGVAITSAGDVIGVLTRRIAIPQTRSFIDLYAVDTGAYRASLALPSDQRWISIGMTEQYLFAASNKGLHRWPLAVATQAVTAHDLSAGQTLLTFGQLQEQTE